MELGTPIITIARLTLREASRRRLLIIVGALTLVVIVLIGWGFAHITSISNCGEGGNTHPCTLAEQRDVEAGLLILIAYMFSFVIAVAAPFVAAPAIAGDVESHVILAMLPRPIHRSDVIIGKWLGLAMLLALYTTLTAGLQFVAVDIAVGYVPPHPILTIAYIVGEAITLMTLALLGSTRIAPIACGIVAVILFGITWMAGIAGQIGAAFGNRVIADVGTVSSLVLPTDGLWRGALYNLEPAAYIATLTVGRETRANPFGVVAPPSTAYLLWAIFWIIGILSLTVWSFNRREL